MSELNTSSDVGPLGFSDEVIGEPWSRDWLQLHIQRDSRWLFGLAPEYKVIGIINLNYLSSISRCQRDLWLCFGTDLHVTSKLETNFTSNQCRRQFLADFKHVALLKSPDKQSFLSCVDAFPKLLLKQEVWTRYIEQLTISVLTKHSNKLLNGHICTVYWLTSTCCTISLASTFVLFSTLRRIFPELQWSCKQLIL